jgi:hypothetical protein
MLDKFEAVDKQIVVGMMSGRFWAWRRQLDAS